MKQLHLVDGVFGENRLVENSSARSERSSRVCHRSDQQQLKADA